MPRIFRELSQNPRRKSQISNQIYRNQNWRFLHHDLAAGVSNHLSKKSVKSGKSHHKIVIILNYFGKHLWCRFTYMLSEKNNVAKFIGRGGRYFFKSTRNLMWQTDHIVMRNTGKKS